MTKECPVIINNAAVTVVKFDNTEVQFPSIGTDAKTVKVKFAKGKYTLVGDSEPEVKSEPAEVEPEQAEEMKAIEETFVEIV